MEPEPPFHETYKNILANFDKFNAAFDNREESFSSDCQYELPLIDLSRLNLKGTEARQCKREITDAASKWGFFQVVNHGVSKENFSRVGKEQMKLFNQPLETKSNMKFLNNTPSNCYRWGSPFATNFMQLSWSEVFHIPLVNFSDGNNLSSAIKEYTMIVNKLAQRIANILAENLAGRGSDFFAQNCLLNSSYLRMNRYPPCPCKGIFGLMPHTDSDFLTVLNQDQVGGLQLVKDGRWITVRPNPKALIINIGDLFQAWSNGIYKSVEHRVVTNQEFERLSIAYFLCPTYDTVIETHNPTEPSIYKRFTFREYIEQVQEDVKAMGKKVGLSRFAR